MQRVCLIGSAVLAGSMCSGAFAAISLSLDTLQVPQSSSAVVDVIASGGDSFVDFEFDAKLNDGAGATPNPFFTGAPQFVFTGSAISSANVFALPGIDVQYFPGYSVDTINGGAGVTASGVKIARMTLNTSSLNPGDTFTIDLFDNDFPTFFTGVSTIESAPFTLQVVVPEPATFGALAAGVGMLAMRRRRRA